MRHFLRDFFVLSDTLLDKLVCEVNFLVKWALTKRMQDSCRKVRTCAI